MELNDVKKHFYKNHVNAELVQINKEGLHYHARFYETPTTDSETFVYIKVPFNDIQDGRFFSNMHAKDLIRWIVFSKTEQ